METVEMTWVRATKAWWYFFWRAMFFTLISSFLIGVLVGIVGLVAALTEDTIRLIATAAGFPIGCIISIWVFTYLPEKKFSDFRIVLVKVD